MFVFNTDYLVAQTGFCKFHCEFDKERAMHIYNTTFVCSDRDLPELLGLLRKEVIPVLIESGHAQTPRLSRVASSVPGAEEAESISLQFEFNDISSLAEWKKQHLQTAITVVEKKFGSRVLTFSTLLQVLPHA